MNDYLDSPAPPAKSLWSYALRWGLIGTAITSLFGLLMFVLEQSDQSWLNLVVNLAIFSGTLYMAMKEFRDKENGGLITFGKAYGTGMATTLVVAIGSAIWAFLFFTLIAPNMLEEIKNLTMQQMEEQEMSEEDIKTSMEFVGMMFTPLAMVIWMTISTFFFGAIISLVCAGIAQKK